MPLLLASFATLDWAILGGYLLLIVLIGLWAGGRQKTNDSFFLAGRGMPSWAVSLSLLATSLSAATFIGAPQEAYAGNLSYLILNIGAVIGAVLVAFLFLPRFYRAKTTTIYGYLGLRFGAPARIAASVMFLIGRLLASGARLFFAGTGFALMLYGVKGGTDLHNLIPAIVLLGVIGTVYTACGGIRAVIWTDVAQIIIVVGAAGAALYLLVQAIPMSPGEIVQTLASTELEPGSGTTKLDWFDWRPDLTVMYTLWGALAMTLFNMAAYGADQDLTQRLLTCKSPTKATWSLVSATIIGLPVTALFMALGLLLYLFYARPDIMGPAAPQDVLGESEKVFPQYVLNHLPTGLSGLAMAGLFAAAMSSFDSAANAMGSSIIGDLIGRDAPEQGGSSSARRGLDEPAGPPVVRPSHLRQSRTTVLIIGLVLTAAAVGAATLYAAGNGGGGTLLSFALGVMTFAYGGLLGVFLAAIFTRRGNSDTVILALVGGALVVAGCYTMRWWGPSLAGRLPADESLLTHLRPLLEKGLAFPYWMVLATSVSFFICIAGKPDRLILLRHDEHMAQQR